MAAHQAVLLLFHHVCYVLRNSVFVSVALELAADEYSLEVLAAPMMGSSCTFQSTLRIPSGIPHSMVRGPRSSKNKGPASVRTVFTSINIDIHLNDQWIHSTTTTIAHRWLFIEDELANSE
jgi:hypothetical protein